MPSLFFFFPPPPIYNAKVTWKKTSLTLAVHAQGQRGGICPQQCASLLRHRCNWSGKTHYRNQKWSEHFPSGKPLHRRTPGQTHQEMLEEIASRFTWHFSLGLSDGISCRARSGEINWTNGHGEAVPFFFFFFFDSLTLNRTAAPQAGCVFTMVCCVYWLAIAKALPRVWLWPPLEIFDYCGMCGLLQVTSVSPMWWPC